MSLWLCDIVTCTQYLAMMMAHAHGCLPIYLALWTSSVRLSISLVSCDIWFWMLYMNEWFVFIYEENICNRRYSHLIRSIFDMWLSISETETIHICIRIRRYLYSNSNPNKKNGNKYNISNIRPYPILLHPYLRAGGKVGGGEWGVGPYWQWADMWGVWWA
jgi:hypothetical protein